MPQSLLAFLGIMLLGTTTLTLTSSQLHLQEKAITRELEEMGAALALEVLEVISARSFDQAVMDGSTSGSTADLNLFSYDGATHHFTTGNACAVFNTGSDTCNDIDDFHAMVPATLPFLMGNDTIYFRVEVDVQYVDDALARFNGRTFNKEVRVTVQDEWPSGREPFLRSSIELSRVFSYGF